MPSAKKVKWSQLRVGLMAVAALTILGLLVFLLTGTRHLFVRTATIHTYMSDSAALASGAPVRLNGIVVGSVSRVGLSGLAEPRRIVRVDMTVTQDFLSSIPVDSEAAISAENVLGTKFINIRMGRSAETIQPGGVLPSRDTTEFDEVIQSGYDVMVAARGLLRRINDIVSEVEEGRGSIGKFLVDEEFYNRLTATVTETQKVAEAINTGRGTVGRLLYDESLYDDIRTSVHRLDEMLAGVQRGEGTAGRLMRDTELYDEARKTMAELRQVAEDLNAGKGTAGRLLKDEELHAQIQNVVARLDTTMQQINTGQGTLGQLMVNPNLYESINGMSQELEGLLKDFRADPRKFLRIRVSLF